MYRSYALIHAIIGSRTTSKNTCECILKCAKHLQTDPISVIIHKKNVTEQDTYRRAAKFCGMAYSDTIPCGSICKDTSINVTQLAHIRSIRGKVYDRDVSFISPTFEQFLALRIHLAKNQELARRICIVPPRAMRQALYAAHASLLNDEARQGLARKWPHASAHLDLTLFYRLSFMIGLLLFLLLGTLSFISLNALMLPFLLLILLVPAWFRLCAIFSHGSPTKEEATPPFLLADVELPIYTVLIPLRDEAHMVPQIAEAMQHLHYPKEKLDIKFVVEAKSPATVSAVQNELHAFQFELIVVPDSAPRTKPKALNFALPAARGEYLVVFDAEDLPAPDQLRQAATLFADNALISCIQSELVVGNAKTNSLTALFSAEYSSLFGIILPTLADWQLPMPLGGTSNHFRLSVLREIGGWDAFNVTEDADIGIRLARLKLKSITMPARTVEEMPTRIKPWLRQRTRWMKGWMQTLLVHNRHPSKTLEHLGWPNFIAFQIYITSLIVTPPLHTLFILSVAFRFLIGEPLLMWPQDNFAILHYFVLIGGHISAIALSILGTTRLSLKNLMWHQLALPLYWALQGVAVLLAGLELVRRPFHWQKTDHTSSLARQRSAKTNLQHFPSPHMPKQSDLMTETR